MKKAISSLIRNFLNKLELSSESDPLLNPLSGDICVQYAFVIKNLLKLNKGAYKTVLDVGCCKSPLTTIIKELGFAVDGIDLRPTPVLYNGVNYIQGNFLSTGFKNSYDVVVMCYVIEHIGLKGRYTSPEIEDGDVKALKKAKQILNPGGILIITVPYGKEKTIKPLHRIYNKNSKPLKYVYEETELIVEEFYKNNSENIWVKCEESEAREIVPTEDNFALGLFAFRKKL